MSLDPQVIERARAVRIEDEVARLGVKLKRAARSEFVGPCPVCGGDDRFGVNVRKQVWHCRVCDRGGGVIDLVMHVAGLSFAEACRELTGEYSPGALQRIAERPAAAPVPRDDDAAKVAMASRLWREAVPIEGTLAETYLRRRLGLELPDDMSGRVLRFHPNCPFSDYSRDPPTKIVVPAMVALFRTIEGDEPRAIHRTALSRDGRKADLPKTKLILGRISGAAIKLSRDVDVTYGLTIGEGLETTLAGMAEGFKPAWVVGLPGIMKFPVLAGVDCLTILVDNDKPDRNGRQAGPVAAAECSARWTTAGREVRRVVPRALGADMADLRMAS